MFFLFDVSQIIKFEVFWARGGGAQRSEINSIIFGRCRKCQKSVRLCYQSPDHESREGGIQQTLQLE